MEKFRFNLEEAAGAIGDYGTLIPIIIGVTAVTDLKLATILFFFGIFYIGIGVYYKLPMPVEPMKAIGTIAIAGKLSSMEIVGAGVTTGLIFILIGLTGTMQYIKKSIPNSIIRGIQFGLVLKLLKTAIDFTLQTPYIGGIAIIIIIVFYFASILDISALVVFTVGLIWGIYTHGLPPLTNFVLPELSLPSFQALKSGFWQGTLPQLPLTLGNSVLATSLLIKDLFNREVKEDKIVTSVGIMSIISSPLGGFPMCHGAGGLAAQYRFGARTGGSNIISGIILLLISFFFASQELIQIIPYGILGALLFFSSLQLFDSTKKTDNWLFTGLTGLLAFVIDMSIGFIIMLIIYWVKEYLTKSEE